MTSFYGIKQLSKNYTERLGNTLLPISYLKYIFDHKIKPNLFFKNAYVEKSLNLFTSPDSLNCKTEISFSNNVFIHSPPHDVYIEDSMFLESKISLYKQNKSELILRQDCYSFNILQNIIIHNPNKKWETLESLLSDTTVEESFYLNMLLWSSYNGKILFDHLFFTDLQILQLIYDANTKRSHAAIKLIDNALSLHFISGQLIYKLNKNDTVPHQKVSLFPLKTLNFSPSFQITDKNLITTYKPKNDANLWQELTLNSYSTTGIGT